MRRANLLSKFARSGSCTIFCSAAYFAFEEQLLTELGLRIRDVRQGPDQTLYVLTDEDNGQLLRIVTGR